MNDSDEDTDDENEIVESDDDRASNDDETPVNDEWENAMDVVDNEAQLSREEGEVEQTDGILVPEVEEETSSEEQGDVNDENSVDVPVDTEDEDAGSRLRSGTRYVLRVPTKIVNYRDRFEHDFSGANVGIKGQATCPDDKSRSAHKTS